MCNAQAHPGDADVDIPAGAEVMHTYGDLSDAELLTTFGFIDAIDLEAFSNPNNRVRPALISSC